MLVSVSHDGVVDDVAVECPPEAKVGAVADAVSSALCLPVENPTLRVLSRSVPAVGRDERLLAAGIHDGDVLALVRATGTCRAARATVTLTALTGPAQGRVYKVEPGRSRIGRDPSAADVVIADPAISRVHAVVQVSDTIEVSDAGSTNGVILGGQALEGSARVGPAQSFVVGDTELVVARLDEQASGTSLAVPHNPTPRIFAPFAGHDLVCPAPPAPAIRQPIPWLSALLPLIAGAAIAAISHSLFLLAFMLLSPILLFTAAYEGRRQQGKEHAEAVAEWEEAVDDVMARQAALQEDERRRRHEGSPSVDLVASWAATRDRRVWERSADHADVLNLRVGTATLPSSVTISLASGGRLRDRRRVEGRLASTRHLAGVPVAIPLAEVGHVGISGGETAGGLARSLLAQAAALHSPAVLSIAAIVEPGSVDDWQWLKWLPHTRSGIGAHGGQLVCARPESAVRLVEHLTGLVRARIEASSGDAVAPATRVLLLVDGASSVDPARLAELYATGPRAGVHVIFVGGSPNSVPRACGAVVTAGTTVETCRVAFTAGAHVVCRVAVETLTVRAAEAMSRAVAPLVDTSAPVSAGADLPDRVNLVALLGGPQIMMDPRVIGERWAESRDITAVVGAVAGSVLRLDMRTDGPHALVAGTTGAGKSELLQTLIAALAVSHSPTRVNFLLVDYKGGAAFRECRDLPHTVGMVTDLNTQEVRRALVSLDAEITRRERLLDLAGAKNLADHELLGREDTPANLFIIVDEFAALVKEVPEFVAGMVDLAQRGRTLGMHLVLATQRPAGVISASIRANATLRIALRVADDAESIDVVERADAADIAPNTPGRGVCLVAPKEIRLFQAGYVGGRTSPEEPLIEVGVRGFRLDGGDAIPPCHPAAGGGDAPKGPTDLQRIVSVTALAAERLGLDPPHRPWLDPLPAVLDLRAVAAASTVAAGCVVVGELDDPEHQRRRPALLDLSRRGSVLVLGAGRSGKTAFLRTVAAAIGVQHGEPMDVYGLDFVGRGLTMLFDLPYVGEVVAGDDGERLVRLLSRLQATVERRASLFAAARVADLAEYRRRTAGTHERRIVVLLDGLQAFEAAYERVDRGAIVDALPRLIGEGRAAGVHFVITADRRGSVRSAVFGLINTLVVLRQSGADELSNLNLTPDAIAMDAPPGRFFLDGLEGQAGLLGPPDGEGQVAAMAELAAAIPPCWTAPAVPRVPLEVRRTEVPRVEGLTEGRVLLGLDAVALQPITVDLLRAHLCVLGRRGSGRTTALAALARGMSPEGADGDRVPTELVLATARPSPLRAVARWDRVVDNAGAAHALLAELADRPPAPRPVVLFVDDLTDLGDAFDAGLAELLGRTERLHVVVAAETRAALSSFAGSVLGELRHAQRGLVLQPNLPDHEDIFDVRLGASSTMRFPPGRGFLVDEDQATVVQVVLG